MAVGNYCRRDVQTVSPRETLRAAARCMQDKGVGCLVVTHEGRPQGVITDRDLALRVLRERLDPDSVPVRDIIGRDPAVIHENMPLGVVSKMMRRLCVRRLPVVDDGERIVGVITADDLLRLLSREVSMLGEAVAAQARIGDLRDLETGADETASDPAR